MRADLRDAVGREDDLSLLVLLVDELARFPLDLEPLFAVVVLPLLFLLALEDAFAFEAGARLLPELVLDLELLPLLGRAIVSAAAPMAPTAAPVAAPASISPATSMAFSTIFVVVDFRERDEVERLLFELLLSDLLAINFLP